MVPWVRNVATWSPPPTIGRPWTSLHVEGGPRRWYSVAVSHSPPSGSRRYGLPACGLPLLIPPSSQFLYPNEIASGFFADSDDIAPSAGVRGGRELGASGGSPSPDPQAAVPVSASSAVAPSAAQ